MEDYTKNGIRHNDLQIQVDLITASLPVVLCLLCHYKYPELSFGFIPVANPLLKNINIYQCWCLICEEEEVCQLKDVRQLLE